MFKFYLIVLIMTGSGWKVDHSDGWGPKEQPNWKVCIERRDFFNHTADPRQKAICRKRVK